jgi:hypothetical protein
LITWSSKPDRRFLEAQEKLTIYLRHASKTNRHKQTNISLLLLRLQGVGCLLAFCLFSFPVLPSCPHTSPARVASSPVLCARWAGNQLPHQTLITPAPHRAAWTYLDLLQRPPAEAAVRWLRLRFRAQVPVGLCTQWDPSTAVRRGLQGGRRRRGGIARAMTRRLAATASRPRP